MYKRRFFDNRACSICVALLVGLFLAVAWRSSALFAADPVTVTVLASANVRVNEPFTATVALSGSPSQEIDGVGVYLNFDPTMLAVLSVEDTSPLDLNLVAPAYDNVAGTVELVKGTLGDRPTLPFDQLKIVLLPLKAGVSAITFSSTFPRETQVTAFGAALDLNLTPATITATQDTTPPVITLLGANPMTVEALGSYVDPGATATDNVDGNLSAAIVVGGVVNTGKVGEYRITYNVRDAAGNAAPQQVRVVRVVDTTPPVITLLGANSLVVNKGDPFVDPGATASDTLDGNLTGQISVSGVVNTDLVGSYTLTYRVQDRAGNAATPRTRTVRVIFPSVADTTPPILTLLGANPMIVEALSSYVEPGATATDNVDGNLSAAIVVAGVVNTGRVGDYNVTYNVRDAAGNAAPQQVRVVRVVDTTPPVIALLGENPLMLEMGDPFVDPGATASDTLDGDLTDQIQVTGANIDTELEGRYTVRYRVADAAGNVVEATRLVEVAPPTTVTVEDQLYLPIIRPRNQSN
ncbi:MAG: DUF5011 domain-containing protein [Caldilineaceae bacterium]|nr:DUF5011 domain-containing protein [Caldilineaceae bacterium]